MMMTQPCTPSHQRGAVLFVALVILVILTVLGVTTMNTSFLEQRMVTSAQDSARIFQAAESGLSELANNPDAYTPAGYAETDKALSDSGYEADLSTEFVGATTPAPDSGWGTDFRAYHFRLTSVGKKPALFGSGEAVTLNGGAYQIGRK